MNNFDNFKSFFQSFGSVEIESTLCDASFDKTNGVHLYGQSRKNLRVISLDKFCDKVYRDLNFKNSEIDDLCSTFDLKPYNFNICSPDAFLVDKDGYWYLIEFKNSSYSSSSCKDSVVAKAYQTFIWLCDLFYRSKNTEYIPDFDFSNPLSFARKKIRYLLIVSEDKNPQLAIIQHKYTLAHEVFRPYYLEKLRHYLFNEAWVFTENEFEIKFVDVFKYV